MVTKTREGMFAQCEQSFYCSHPSLSITSNPYISINAIDSMRNKYDDNEYMMIQTLVHVHIIPNYKVLYRGFLAKDPAGPGTSREVAIAKAFPW